MGTDISMALQIMVLGYGILGFSALVVVLLIVFIGRLLIRKKARSGRY